MPGSDEATEVTPHVDDADLPVDWAPDAGRRLRVMIAADTFPPDVNGAATFAEQLAVGLAQRGHEVHVIAPASSRQHGTFDEEHGGVTLIVHRLFSLKWPLHAWLRFALPWNVRRDVGPIMEAVQPDVIHIQSHVVIGRGVAREASERGIRVIATNHFMPENLLEYAPFGKHTLPIALKIAWGDAAKTYRFADAVTAPTQLAADYLEAAIGKRDVMAISCGIDISRYVSIDERPERNEIVFVGRVAPEKQLDVLVRALRHLPDELEARLTIVGDGEQVHKLTALARELGLEHRVRFLGFVSDDVKRQTLTHATVFAMPSTAELQSISSLEGMASGLPIVAANAMALPHLVDGNGYLFVAGDELDLASKLAAVLTAPEDAYLRMKRRSVEMAGLHDINRTLSTFEALYRGNSVAAGAGTGR
ncbi:glycosyltransferase [Curtobacterium ammoniigenes]|uniref:glycosyltransferase n=1 Tax=Curtobacterium ammoniigenes TaxID=395387 RepID=UPI000ADDCA66|nr:glycosyltransferase [Curtobacterium ammoniigenes]